MKKILVALGVVTSIAIIASADLGCGPNALCPSGEVACGNSCMPAGDTCCDSYGDYCPQGYLCGPGNSCINPYADPCTVCLTHGEECCQNADGRVDCAPLGAACCGNHRYCPSGFVCGGGCGSECCR